MDQNPVRNSAFICRDIWIWRDNKDEMAIISIREVNFMGFVSQSPTPTAESM
jgi:hypothetical protein